MDPVSLNYHRYLQVRLRWTVMEKEGGEMREGGVEIGLETGTSFGQGFARIRNANFVIFVLEYQKEQREKNQVRIVFINL